MTDSQVRPSALIFSESDNVAVMLQAVSSGDRIVVQRTNDWVELSAKSDIAQYHKVAVTAISKETKVVRSATEIGIAVKDIAAGEWVHTHNLKSLRGKSV